MEDIEKKIIEESAQKLEEEREVTGIKLQSLILRNRKKIRDMIKGKDDQLKIENLLNIERAIMPLFYMLNFTCDECGCDIDVEENLFLCDDCKEEL